MSLVAPARTEVGAPVSGGPDEGLRALALLLGERSVPYGFVSLLLAGSLGRGEGSLLLTPDGPQIFNDVDLVLVTERPVPSAVAFAWEEEASRLLAPDSPYARDRLSPLGLHVDLAVLPRTRLRRLPCTLFNFDLQSARVLAGEDVLPELPAFQAPDIPAREALLLLGNRCLSLCESAGPPESGAAIWMYYHALKAVIDAGTALLILSGPYRRQSRERLLALDGVIRTDYPSFFGRWPQFTDMVEAAVGERRRLRADLRWGEAVAQWKDARDVILHALLCALGRVLGVPEHWPWAALSGRMRRWYTSFGALAEGRCLPTSAARWVALRVAGRPRRLLAQAAVHAAAPHLLLAIEPGGESPPEYHGDLALAGSCLAKLVGRRPPCGADGDWRAVRDVVIGCWKGIV
jgi:hypothetical protein